MDIKGTYASHFEIWNPKDLNCLKNTILNSIDIDENSRIATVAVNSVIHISTFLATWSKNAVICPIGSKTNFKNINSISDCLKDCQPTAIITDSYPINFEVPDCAEVLVLDLECQKILERIPAKNKKNELNNYPNSAAILYTSGTSSHSKGVVLSRKNLQYTFQSNQSVSELNSDSRFYHCLPVSHMAGFANLISGLVYGARVYEGSSFTWINSVMSQLINHEITTVGLVPFYFSRILEHKSFQDLYCLNLIILSASPIDTTDIRTAQRLNPNIKYKNAYGLTEAFRSTVLQGENSDTKFPSIGQCSEGVEIKIVDDSGSDSNFGQAYIRGPNRMIGYWQKPELDSEYIVDGWLKTGDLLKKGDDNNYYLIGRSIEIVEGAGEKVSIVQLESVISNFLNIKNLGVVAQQSRRGVSDIALVVDESEKSDNFLKKVRNACVGHFHSVFFPRRVVYTNEFPRTSVGKIDRKKLNQIVDKEVEVKKDAA